MSRVPALLPASAVAGAPQVTPTVVLGQKVDPWLTRILQEVKKEKSPLNSSRQHEDCLTTTLAGPEAIWTLAYIILPKRVDSELSAYSLPLGEDSDYQILQIQAYVVHTDMISENEVSFKPTPETINDLIECHKAFYSSEDVICNLEHEIMQTHALQEMFRSAVSRFVCRTDVKVLEGLLDYGFGEVLEGRSEEVKKAILDLSLPPISLAS